jgi:hypothetical protein
MTDFRNFTKETLSTIVVPALEQNKNRQGHYLCNPKLNGKDITMTSPIVSAKGWGASGPNAQYDITGYSMPVGMVDPRGPPLGTDGKPDTSTFDTKEKCRVYFENMLENSPNQRNEHKFFATLLRFKQWFKEVVKSRSEEFLDDAEPSDKDLEKNIVDLLKYNKKREKMADNLHYGPKFQPEIREKIVKTKLATGEVLESKDGFQCEVRDVDGSIISVPDIVGRKYTCMVTSRLASVWKLGGRCGMKWECIRVDIIEYFDSAVKVEINRNMYDECPEVDEAMIAATEAAEQEATRKRLREEEEEPEEESVPEPVEESAPSPVKKTKKRPVKK